MQAICDACLDCGPKKLGIPTTEEGWHRLADTFARPEYPEFDTPGVRVCLAGDGTLIGFSTYEAVDYFAKEKWRCRKGFLATNCVFYFDGYRRYGSLALLENRVFLTAFHIVVHADIMYEGCCSGQVRA